MNTYYQRKTCRICDSQDMGEIINLGEMPPANAFLENPEKKEETFPLRLYFCNNCSLVQLVDVVDPNILFGEYHYISSASTPLVEHFSNYAKMIKEKFVRSPDNLVVDIGGNDGVLLEHLKSSCCVLNVEPAKNIAEFSKQKGILTLNNFFSKELAEDIKSKHGEARVVTANNVVAHIDDIHDVFKGIKELIGEDGVFVFEVHWVGNLIGEGGFDQIYHEHLSYFSLHALKYFVEKVIDLVIFDAELVPIHGKSLRVYVATERDVSPRVSDILSQEKERELDNIETYFKFSKKVEKNKKRLKKLLTKLKKQEKSIVGYGAPAKGNTLLNYFEIGPDILDYIIDTTSLKQGRYTPGTHIPVVAPEKAYKDVPDYFLLLAWNYADAILEKEKALQKKGVKFIIPVPEVKVV